MNRIIFLFVLFLILPNFIDSYFNKFASYNSDINTIPSQSPHTPKATKRIKNGYKVDIRQLPSLGAVGWESKEGGERWRFKCACTLIHAQFALSAAHCSKAAPHFVDQLTSLKPKMVRFGTEDLRDAANVNSRLDMMILDFVSHPEYKSPIRYNDIAIIVFENKIGTNIDTIKPACLKRADDVKEGTRLLIAGWGLQAEYGEPSLDLMAAIVHTLPNSKCLRDGEVTRNFQQGLRSNQICAGSSEDKDTCSGDSGGPLLVPTPISSNMKCAHVLVGVTQFSFFSCAIGMNDTATVYSKVAGFYDWILEELAHEHVSPRINF